VTATGFGAGGATGAAGTGFGAGGATAAAETVVSAVPCSTDGNLLAIASSASAIRLRLFSIDIISLLNGFLLLFVERHGESTFYHSSHHFSDDDLVRSVEVSTTEVDKVFLLSVVTSKMQLGSEVFGFRHSERLLFSKIHPARIMINDPQVNTILVFV
jgi:hypothetical protein